MNFVELYFLLLKRKIAERFGVYNIDEFRTSKLNYKTEAKSKNLYLPDKKGKTREIHAILTYKMENNRLGCINRDKNAVNNIKKIVKHYFETGQRPYRYRRNVKLQDDE